MRISKNIFLVETFYPAMAGHEAWSRSFDLADRHQVRQWHTLHWAYTSEDFGRSFPA